MILKYQGIYILKSTPDKCMDWAEYLIDKGFDPSAFELI